MVGVSRCGTFLVDSRLVVTFFANNELLWVIVKIS